MLLGLVRLLWHFLEFVLAYLLLSAVPCQPIKRKKEGEEKRMTQEEMLLEAAETGLDYVSLVPSSRNTQMEFASMPFTFYSFVVYVSRDHEHEKSRTCPGKRGGSEEKSCCS